MKKNFRLFALAFTALFATAFHAKAQNEFITEWKFTNATSIIKVYAITTGNVSYSYSASPSGNTGTGSFNNSNPNADTDIPINAAAGDVVTVRVGPANLNRMILGFSPASSYLPNKDDLLEVTQWGNVIWKSMDHMFSGCTNLNVTATDAPNLTAPPSGY